MNSSSGISRSSTFLVNALSLRMCARRGTAGLFHDKKEDGDKPKGIQVKTVQDPDS